MKYKIVVDSSANLLNDYLKNEENIDFEVAPLTIRLLDEEFIDNDNLDVKDMLKKINASEVAAKSSCPSPNDFLKTFNSDKDGYTFVITITKKLSGSFNSAIVAKEMSENKDRIYVLDSKATAGSMVILVDKL